MEKLQESENRNTRDQRDIKNELMTNLHNAQGITHHPFWLARRVVLQKIRRLPLCQIRFSHS
jgi:hypothetical protein